jgi:hypothetical protein
MMRHFGDPCIHCGVPLDEVEIGACKGDPAKAKPIGYRRIATRPDGVDRFRVRFSDGRIEERHSHWSERAPYYHFGHSDVLTQPPRYDSRL